MQNGKGSKDRVNFKKFQDNAEESGIPDLSLRNVATEEDFSPLLESKAFDFYRSENEKDY